MIISVASGKGGTGKTTVSTGLALSISAGGTDVQFLDCDVEEPNAHIFLGPVIKETKKVFIPVPEVNDEKCIYCGRCREVCAYNAIVVVPPRNGKKGNVLVFPNLCHGCGSCAYFCPVKAIKEVSKEVGIIEIGNAGNIQFIQGKLNIGEIMAPPIIRAVKKNIPDYKPDESERVTIIDAPPGTSCTVVESVKGSDFCLLVTEPTPFGLNDLVLAVGVLRKLGIPFGVIINRSSLGNDKTDDYCRKENIPVLTRIPFEREIAVSYSKGISIAKAFPEYARAFRELFEKIKLITKNN